ncbi:hypothetical protein CHRY9390_00495 [Chryseobacterium aquaeductus]|uniref:Uncharacterized protein n=1 Tax=Chryseobacterium aquaeductus TaxID=2675056 RepID=A0A9N8QR21_9FLAO|nr:hypothetical protein CHRY9390_00495 [Chryseobacterium potabilaquae]CAD7799499.1 hypothetical protein CHRY9390_00495 [Chryseobacterium aquaeductus]
MKFANTFKLNKNIAKAFDYVESSISLSEDNKESFDYDRLRGIRLLINNYQLLILKF